MDLGLALNLTCGVTLLAVLLLLGRRIWLIESVTSRIGTALAVLAGTCLGSVIGAGLLMAIFVKLFVGMR